MNVGGSVVAEQLKPAVTLTGTAKDGSGGPPIGVVDIGESERSYLCRVSLPGLKNNESNINCEIERDGKVHVYGVVTGGVLKDPWTMYEMKVQELCPSGRFSISFNLPGPVDPRLASPNFRSDGILEIVVSKPVSPSV